MRVALLTDGIYPLVMGGMQRHSYFMARYLAQQDVHVDLYHCVEHGADLTKALEGFEEKELRNITQFVFNFPKSSRVPGHYVRRSKAYSVQLYETMKTQPQVDFIYAQGFTGWYTLHAKAKGESLPPIGVNFHGLNMFQKNDRSLRARLERKLLRKPAIRNLQRADVAFSLGGEMTTILERLLNDENKVIEVPNGVESAWLAQTPAKREHPIKFVFVGRYDKVKGLDVLYQALKLMGDLDFTIDFVGPIPQKNQWNDARATYHGTITEEDKLKAVFDAADVVVVPSWSEGMPTVILEGMACGLAVIASDVGAVQVLVDETNGQLIQAGDVVALKTKMENMVHMPDQELSKLKASSIQKVKEHFTWDAVITKTLQVFEAAIEQK